jgi:trigger factor
MNITKENIDDLNAVLKVEVKEADYAGNVNEFLKKQQKTAQMQGFRPGKVPFGVIKKKHGLSAKIEEIQKVINRTMYRFIDSEKLNVLGQPLPKDNGAGIDWLTGKDFSIDYEVGLAPTFEVKFSARKKFTSYDIQPDENLIDKYIEEITMRYGAVGTADVVEEKDVIISDLVELENGAPKEGGLVKLGNVAFERLSATVKKQLLGAKVEDTITLNVKEIYVDITEAAKLMDVEATVLAAAGDEYSLKVVSISRMQAAEVNQELFDKVYGEGTVKSVDEFRTKLADEAKGMLGGQSKSKLRNDIVEYLLETTKFDLPDNFLKKFMVATSKEPTTFEAIDAEYDNYKNTLRWQLIENQLVSDNDIKIAPGDVREKAKEMIKANFAQFGQEVSDADLGNYADNVLAKGEEKKKIEDGLYSDKISEVIESKCKVESKEVSYDEFVKISEKK